MKRAAIAAGIVAGAAVVYLTVAGALDVLIELGNDQAAAPYRQPRHHARPSAIRTCS